MKKVKLSINSPKEGLLRQSPNNDGVWGDYKFYINEDIEECDFWVVYSKGEKQVSTTRVAQENLIFLSGEPEPIYHYAPSFIKKFGKILTSRRDILHKNIVYTHPAQPWWVGRQMKSNGDINFVKTFNDLASKGSYNKEKLISVITSDKGFTQGHKDRIKFVQKLKEHFGNSLDVFGKGINGFEDKWETLRDYKYHIVIENSSFNDYWTEKLADNYLAECFPFYHGCKNLDKYFPKESFELIDINDIEKSIDIIENGINKDMYNTRLLEVREAKKLVLNTHNIFPMMANILDNMDSTLPKKSIVLKHEFSYFDPYKVLMLLKRLYIKKFK